MVYWLACCSPLRLGYDSRISISIKLKILYNPPNGFLGSPYKYNKRKKKQKKNIGIIDDKATDDTVTGDKVTNDVTDDK